MPFVVNRWAVDVDNCFSFYAWAWFVHLVFCIWMFVVGL
jgi:hypothetical protein